MSQNNLASTTLPALPPVTPHALRDELTDMVVRDLLGAAGGPKEEFDQREDRVTGRYLVGMLAPKSTPIEAEEQDILGTNEVKGRFAQLLPTKVPDAQMRHFDKPLLKVKGVVGEDFRKIVDRLKPQNYPGARVFRARILGLVS